MPHASEIGGELERIRQAVDAIERRLTRVEHALAEQPAPRPADDAAVREQSRAVNGPHVHSATMQPPPLPPRAAAPPPRVPFAEVSVARPAVVEPPPVPSMKLESPTRSLEELIGQNWASWVGAVVLFLGVVFFLKYAWDQGWLVVPPAARVAAAIAAGGALAAAGEWVHRRSMRALAGTLYGAGAAVVIAAFFAACA